MTDAPYQRIADELRHRIEAGALAPGAKVPSTREIARAWRVAPATAAHALQLLAKSGWIVARPRAGNVVAAHRPRAASGSPPTAPGSLHAPNAARSTQGPSAAPGIAWTIGAPVPPPIEPVRAEILRAAIAIADDEGIAAVSIRSVAAKLGVSPMSLYRHVANKYELVRAMADFGLGETPLPRTPGASGRERLAACARYEWRAFRRHPWAARVVHVSRPSAHPSTLELADRSLEALAMLGATGADALRMHIVMHTFIQGLAINLEAEDEARGETGMSDDDWMASQQAGFRAAIESGRIPTFANMFSTIGPFELDYDQLFELALTTFLDGLESRFAGPSRPKRRG